MQEDTLYKQELAKHHNDIQVCRLFPFEYIRVVFANSGLCFKLYSQARVRRSMMPSIAPILARMQGMLLLGRVQPYARVQQCSAKTVLETFRKANGTGFFFSPAA
jgi:hypothetical protein